jgi:hypothetical protein
MDQMARHFGQRKWQSTKSVTFCPPQDERTWPRASNCCVRVRTMPSGVGGSARLDGDHSAPCSTCIVQGKFIEKFRTNIAQPLPLSNLAMDPMLVRLRPVQLACYAHDQDADTAAATAADVLRQPTASTKMYR